MWEISRLGRQGVDPAHVATVALRAGHKTSGEPVHEEMPAVQLENETWRLLATPGMVEELAAEARGFAGVEAVLKRFTEVHGESWHYENVYDANGEPLGWWLGGE